MERTKRTEEEKETIRAAMRILARTKSDAKDAHLKTFAKNRAGSVFTEEHREKLKQAQAARRLREREDKPPETPAKRRPRGRPKKDSTIL